MAAPDEFPGTAAGHGGPHVEPQDDYHQAVTLADMILAHDLIERIGMDLALELLDVIDGDALLRPELRASVERAAKLIEDEFGGEARATAQLQGVLQHALAGFRA